MSTLRIVLALLGWALLGLGPEAARARRVAVWIDLPETLCRGPRACSAALAWGLRCRWEGAAAADRQRAADGCGPTALQVVLRRTRAAPPQDLLWSICRKPGGGTTLGMLARVARCFGRDARLRWDPQLERVTTPAIVHLKRGHFVVLERRGPGCAWLLDPACGRLRVPWAVLRAAASGSTLVFPDPQLPPPAPRCSPIEVAS